MSNDILAGYRERNPFCAMCWVRTGWLHIHHIVGGAGRKHLVQNLVVLCERCHRALHDGGAPFVVTKSHVLTAKREQDPENYDPQFLATLRHRCHLGYDPAPLPPEIVRARNRRMPEEYTLMTNSRAKGSAGEREAKDTINAAFPLAHARRSQQFSGTEGSADLIVPGTSDLWWEVKRVQALNLQATMTTCREQCGSLTPVILHRKNATEWLLTIPFKDVHVVLQNLLGAK